MEVALGQALSITEASAAGEARRQVQRLAQRLGFDETGAGRLALLATEMAGNLAKHARQGGELLVHPLADDTVGLELLALDRGPGIADVGRALQDGYSTAGSPGTGLGAVGRLADAWDVHSLPGAGTALLARVWAGRAGGPPAGGLRWGGVRLPKAGEEVCGDAAALQRTPQGGLRLLLADGLGHGLGAAEAADAAVRGFLQAGALPPAAVLERLHAALRPTRGAAVAVAEIDPAAGVLRYAGVGNLSGSIHTAGASRSLISHNGTLGHQLHKLQEFDYPWTPESLLVLHSDGLSARWSLERYAGLAARDPALIAGVLWRDCTRGRDDATVLVVGP